MTDDYTRLGDRHGLDWGAVSPADWGVAVRTELEHRDVTNGDLDLTAKIALAHLREDPNYYRMLEPNEKVAEAYWAARGGPPPVTKKTGGGEGRASVLIAILIAATVLLLILVSLFWKRRPAAEGFWGGGGACGACASRSWPSYDPAMLPSEVVAY